MFSKGIGRVVWDALQNSDLFGVLSQLLPRKFQELMTKLSEEYLSLLKDALNTRPWILCYGKVCYIHVNIRCVMFILTLLIYLYNSVVAMT